ncbi:MAG TPA: hypothetical protein VMV93_11330 [Chloroflexota bacterium]|nr:hypothetical protein [Chloroflexota bacterium]
MSIDIQSAWSFRTDPSGAADWSAPGLDASGWDVLSANDFWQNQGYAGYSGVAWYRRTVQVPPEWRGRQAYLALGGVNDEYWVYVNGRLAGHVGDLATHQSAIQRPALTPVPLAAGQQNTIAIRVRSWYNFGGIAHGPVALTTAPLLPSAPVAGAMAIAAAKPAGLWPSWMRGQGRTWTVVGTPSGGPESLVGPTGRWEPDASSPSVALLVGDMGPPSPAGWALQEGDLPIVRNRWRAGAVEVSTVLWRPVQPVGGAQPGASMVRWEVSATNTGAAADVPLFVLLQPYQVQPGVAPIFSASYTRREVLVNGRPFLSVARVPDAILAVAGARGDVSQAILSQRLPPTNAVSDGAGRGSVALEYDLHLASGASTQLSFAAPVGAAPLAGSASTFAQPVAADSASLRATADAWRALLRPGSISLPDARLTAAYTASLAYILMSNDGGALHPGPLLHDAFWYRDSTYMLGALERNGNLAQAHDLLAAMLRFQLPDGSFPANVSTHTQVGHTRGAPEWDAQGEAVHALVDYYRFSHDKAWLRSVWPSIKRGIQWLDELVALQPDGLLPPGASAEDLGPANQRHYWDDFWGVIGLRDASFAAGILGDAATQQSDAAQADALLAAVMRAAQPALHTEGIIPNGPHDLQSPAVARDASPAVWPGQLLPASVAAPIFQRYFQRFVQPYNGAFKEADDNVWTLGGLELAHAALYVGLTSETSQMLAWFIDHPTARGVYAWGDEVTRDGSSLAGGDMPHGWTAAEYVSLLRDMLLYESGNHLELAAGVSAGWLNAPQGVSVSGLPTTFGPISYTLHRVGSTVLLDLVDSTPPPGGYSLHLPFRMLRFSVDGSAFASANGSVLHLPPATRHAEVRVSGS